MDHRRLIFVGVAVAVTGILLVPHLFGGHGKTTTFAPIRVTRSAHAATAAPQLVVDVADAVTAAGGASPKADTTLVNLAAPLADGEQVLVPLRGAAAVGADGTPSPAAPLDLNTVSAEQLDALPGVGPATAQKIVDYRQHHGPFHTVEELEGVPGIGPSKLAQLKGLVIP